MGKRKSGKFKTKDSNPSKKRPIYASSDDDMLNDEIDAFHKQRDVVPLNVNEGAAESDDEDNDHPVFNLEGLGNDDSDDDDSSDDDNEDNDDSGLAAKIVRQARYLRAKTGGIDDEMEEEDEDEKKTNLWGVKKAGYYEGDNVHNELRSSDDESLAEEEAEVVRLQKERAKSLTAGDFGLEDVSQGESDKELTLEEMSTRGRKVMTDLSASKEDDKGIAYEEVKKDLNSLTKEEQMDVVYSSAPELVGLLSELDVAFEELETEVNPLLGKIRAADCVGKGATQYLEVKQILLLSYCQAITFYLLLKSEGQPVRDHPVISRLVEIKYLLDKVKVLDRNLPLELEDILKNNIIDERTEKFIEGNSTVPSVPPVEVHQPPAIPVRGMEMSKALEASVALEDDSLKTYKRKGQNSELQEDKISVLSKERLKLREALEEKMRQKGVFSSIAVKQDRLKKYPQPLNGKLETLEDFDDDAIGVDKNKKDKRDRSLSSFKLVAPTANKGKLASGDDDIPIRDDIGERRRKHEMRVLAGAGVLPFDNTADNAEALSSDGEADEDLDGENDSDIEFYKQVEQKHASKLASKAEIYSRTTKSPPEPEALVDGKRHITSQIEKNRGLTRPRKKLIKNPRKKYKIKHQKAVIRRKGQVRSMREASGPYGGEASGINKEVSRSIRFKN